MLWNRLLVLCLVGCMWIGCGDDGDSTGDTGNSNAGDGDGDGDGDMDVEPPVEHLPCDGAVCFQQIYDEILHNTNAYGCDTPFCHGAGNGGLWMLDMPTTYEELVTVPAAGESIATLPACSETDLVRVVPGDAEASLLFQKVTEAMPVCGDRMPLDPMMALSDEHVELLRTWIDGGAGFE